ncbi:hypothetical protein EUTSA_v10001737mg [Eutrema salsugineum]|uniref:Jacalin-type lectin domain-containing protein n=1 Tax=Eutrema salsugineum TaxID=72664 RepID=V4KMA7_EUTSA|nr:hypothetical protein EUTSA_v10001737mg [Eutrema salsugineum]
MKMFKVGPIGKKDSKDKSWTEKEYTNISNIYIYFDDYGINSIQFSFSHKGTQVLSQKYGLFTGHYFQIVMESILSYIFVFLLIRLKDDEYVTGLSGFYSSQKKISVFN